MDQGGWSLEAIASGPRHGGIRKVRDRTSRLPSSSSSLFLPRFTGKRRARARACGSRGGPVPSLPPPLVSPIHGGAHLERDERAAGEPTRPLTDRVRLLGPLFEATEKSRRCCCPRLFFSLSQPFKQPNYCPIDIDVLDRITPTGTTIRIFGPFFSPPSSPFLSLRS